MMDKPYQVEMQNIDGEWFVIVGGYCDTIMQARRKAAARRKKNLEHKNIRMHSLAVRIVQKVEVS